MKRIFLIYFEFLFVCIGKVTINVNWVKKYSSLRIRHSSSQFQLHFLIQTTFWMKSRPVPRWLWEECETFTLWWVAVSFHLSRIMVLLNIAQLKLNAYLMKHADYTRIFFILTKCSYFSQPIAWLHQICQSHCSFPHKKCTHVLLEYMFALTEKQSE